MNGKERINLVAVNGEVFEVKIGSPSLKRRNKIRELLNKEMKALVEIDEMYDKIIPIDSDTPQEIKDYAKTAEFAIKAIEKNTVIEETKDEYLIKMVAAIITLDSTTQKYKSEVESPYNSEFWANQDTRELQAGLDFFRIG